MTTYNGYTKDLSPEEKRANEIEAIRSILSEDASNEYWQARLEAIETEEPECACFEFIGDNDACPVHGKPFTDAEIKADYQERNELYMMGMGA